MKRYPINDLIVEVYDDEIDVRSLSPENAAEVAGAANGGVAAGGAREGATTALDQFLVLLSPRLRAEGYGVVWFEPIRTTPLLVDRHELPLKLLVAAQEDAHGTNRHRILAAVYHVEAEAGLTGAVGPRPGHDQQLDAVAIQRAPKVDHAEHRTDEAKHQPGDRGDHRESGHGRDTDCADGGAQS